MLSQIGLQCSSRHAEHIFALSALLSNAQHLDPSPAVLREYSSGREVQRLGERGESFAALVETILADPSSADAYRSWLRRPTPRDLDDVAIMKGALGEPLFAPEHRGREFAAPILSDGTLRFAALTAVFFQPDMPQTLILEEIENGIHPSQLRLLVEFLRTRSSEIGPRVMASTHSPVVVDWLQPEDYKHCFLCRHDETTGVSLVEPLSKLPGFSKIVERQPAGELLRRAGWRVRRGFKVLVVPEDPTHNGDILEPLIAWMITECGRPHAKVQVLTNSKVRGTSMRAKGCRRSSRDTSISIWFSSWSMPTARTGQLPLSLSNRRMVPRGHP